MAPSNRQLSRNSRQLKAQNNPGEAGALTGQGRRFSLLQICYSKQALKFLAKQEDAVRSRIRRAIESLPSGDVKKLVGQVYYRLRVGDFRVLFTRDGHIIEVAKIDNRGQVYK